MLRVKKIPSPSCVHLNLYVQASRTDQETPIYQGWGFSGLLEVQPSFKTAKGRLGELSLTLIYIKADELLYTLPVLQLSRAVAGILTWLSKGTFCFPHLLIHSSQTQPGTTQGESTRERGLVSPALMAVSRSCSLCTWAGKPWLHLQGDNVSVGCLDSNTERVLPIAIHRVLVRPSLEEQADLTAGGKGDSIRAELPAPPPHSATGRGLCASTGRQSLA